MAFIDSHGYRANVGIIITNDQQQVLWAKRIKQEAWQFPQGGIRAHETPEQALWRELHEEVGLNQHQVTILAVSKRWLRYQLPKQLIRYHSYPLCIGQKQKWFLLKLQAPDTAVHLEHAEKPEFSTWRWVDFWHPLSEVVNFKRQVYKLALQEFAQVLDIKTLTKGSCALDNNAIDFISKG